MFGEREDLRLEFVQTDVTSAVVDEGKRFAERGEIVITFVAQDDLDSCKFGKVGRECDFQTDSLRRPDFGGSMTAAFPLHRPGDRHTAVTAVTESVGRCEFFVPRRLQKAVFELPGNPADRVFYPVYGDGDFRFDGAQELFAGEEIFQTHTGEVGG